MDGEIPRTANKKHRTTEDLRDTLFDTIDGVRSGHIDTRQAKAVSDLADKIIKTADLEMDYARTCDQLDKSDNGILPRPMLLTSEKKGAA